MSRVTIVVALFGAISAVAMAVPANAVPASPSRMLTENVVGSVQSIGHRRGYRRNHGSGVRLYFGSGRRHHGGGNRHRRRGHH